MNLHNLLFVMLDMILLFD